MSAVGNGEGWPSRIAALVGSLLDCPVVDVYLEGNVRKRGVVVFQDDDDPFDHLRHRYRLYGGNPEIVSDPTPGRLPSEVRNRRRDDRCESCLAMPVHEQIEIVIHAGRPVDGDDGGPEFERGFIKTQGGYLEA